MLLPIGENTVIGTTLDALERDDRIDDDYVSTNEKFADAFDAYLDESEYEKPELSVEDTAAEAEKFGVVGALAQLVDREDLTDDTLVIGGDNLISFDVADFLDVFQNTGDPTIAAYDVGSYDRTSSNGLVELDDDNEVVDFKEKPDDPKSTLVSIACDVFPDEDLPKLEQYLAADNNPDEPGWFVQWLQARETVRAYTFGSGGSSEARSSRSRTGSEATRETEAWFDIGTSESYLDAIAWHLGGQNHVHQSAELHDVDLGENVQIMPGAELANTTIDNSVVFPDATLRDCDVRRSLIDEDTLVESLKLSGAVIGAHTRMNGKL